MSEDSSRHTSGVAHECIHCGERLSTSEPAEAVPDAFELEATDSPGECESPCEFVLKVDGEFVLEAVR